MTVIEVGTEVGSWSNELLSLLQHALTHYVKVPVHGAGFQSDKPLTGNKVAICRKKFNQNGNRAT